MQSYIEIFKCYCLCATLSDRDMHMGRNYQASCIRLGNNVTPQKSRRCMHKSHIIWAYLIYFTELNCVDFSLQFTAVRGLNVEGMQSVPAYY